MINSRATVSEADAEQAPELKEYHYYVGYIETTAMLTPEMAETLGATPVDEPLEESTGASHGRRGYVEAAGSAEQLRTRQQRSRTARNKKSSGDDTARDG